MSECNCYLHFGHWPFWRFVRVKHKASYLLSFTVWSDIRFNLTWLHAPEKNFVFPLEPSEFDLFFFRLYYIYVLETCHSSVICWLVKFMFLKTMKPNYDQHERDFWLSDTWKVLILMNSILLLSCEWMINEGKGLYPQKSLVPDIWGSTLFFLYQSVRRNYKFTRRFIH